MIHILFRAGALVLTAAVLVSVTAADPVARPHIILVMADDQGYGDAGFTGHPFLKTPHLDAMAKAGIVFNRFYAAAPVCSPTRASVMSGRSPMRTNVPNHGHYMRSQEITIAEALKEVGYVTGHFGKWHIGSVQKESPTSPGGQGFDEWLTGLNFFDLDPYLSRNGQFAQVKGQGSVITMDATIEFLKKHKDANKPMFAVTWFPAPHDPHLENPLAQADNESFDYPKHAPYYREIALIDQQMGRLRASLRELAIAENTIVWYCSDNGGLVPETSGGREKKASIYEGGLRVPAVVEWPATYKPGIVDTPVGTVDLYPTLLAIAGAAVATGATGAHQPKLDGIDLADVIAGKQTTRPALGFWHNYTGGENTHNDVIIKKLMEAQQAGQPTPYPERLLKNSNTFPSLPRGDYKGHAAWNVWPWKLHRIQKGEQVTVELYHLVDDPMEAKDLSGEQSERTRELLQQLEAWQSSVFDSWEGKDYAPEPPR